MHNRLIQVAALTLLVAGCSTTSPKYNPQDSYAPNVARAAGICAKLEDRALPKDTVSGITDSAGFGFAMAASGYNAPLAINRLENPGKRWTLDELEQDLDLDR